MQGKLVVMLLNTVWQSLEDCGIPSASSDVLQVVMILSRTHHHIHLDTNMCPWGKVDCFDLSCIGYKTVNNSEAEPTSSLRKQKNQS